MDTAPRFNMTEELYMRTRTNLHLRIMAFCLLLSIVVGGSTALAISNTRSRTVYYPSSGQSSGVFTNLVSSPCTYSYLPGTTIYINYSYESDNNNDTIRFYKNGNIVDYAFLTVNNGTLGTTTVNLANGGAGSYTVEIVSNSTGDEKIFAFDLYTN